MSHLFYIKPTIFPTEGATGQRNHLWKPGVFHLVPEEQPNCGFPYLCVYLNYQVDPCHTPSKHWSANKEKVFWPQTSSHCRTLRSEIPFRVGFRIAVTRDSNWGSRKLVCETHTKSKKNWRLEWEVDVEGRPRPGPRLGNFRMQAPWGMPGGSGLWRGGKRSQGLYPGPF